MALIPTQLAAQLAGINAEGKTQQEVTLEFATIITNYIKTAQVVGTGTGANGGGPISTVVQGTLQ